VLYWQEVRSSATRKPNRSRSRANFPRSFQPGLCTDPSRLRQKGDDHFPEEEGREDCS
jgi:hypothetical protein